MQCTVLVASRGDASLLQATLRQVRDQVNQLPVPRGDGKPGEVLLVWTCAKERVDPILRAQLDPLVDGMHFEASGNKAKALNGAIGAARGKLLVFTEQEALPQPNWLAQLLAPLLVPNSPWAGASGPITPVFPPGGAPAWLRALLGQSSSSALGPYLDLDAESREYELEEGRGPLPFGLNVAYRRAVLRENPIPEAGGSYAGVGLRSGEDCALALGLMLAGHRIVYAPAARVHIDMPPRRFALEYARAVYQVDGNARGHTLAAHQAFPTNTEPKMKGFRATLTRWQATRQDPILLELHSTRQTALLAQCARP